MDSDDAQNGNCSLSPQALASLTAILDDLTQACARHLSITREETSDFQVELKEHILCHAGRLAAWQRTEYSKAWAYACTRHYAIDFLRRLNKTRGREVSLPEPQNTMSTYLRLFLANPLDPETEMVRQELREKVLKALVKLSDSQQELLIGYHVLGNTIEELATLQNRTKCATRQALSAAGKQLKSILKRMGVDDVEAAEYLAVVLKPLPEPCALF